MKKKPGPKPSWNSKTFARLTESIWATVLPPSYQEIVRELGIVKEKPVLQKDATINARRRVQIDE